MVYELDDYKTPSDDLVKHLQAIIDEAFGRTGPKVPDENASRSKGNMTHEQVEWIRKMSMNGCRRRRRR